MAIGDPRSLNLSIHFVRPHELERCPILSFPVYFEGTVYQKRRAVLGSSARLATFSSSCNKTEFRYSTVQYCRPDDVTYMKSPANCDLIDMRNINVGIQ